MAFLIHFFGLFQYAPGLGVEIVGAVAEMIYETEGYGIMCEHYVAPRSVEAAEGLASQIA